jgi:hypothetical protein
VTQPGSFGYYAPQDPLTSVMRRIEDLERTVASMKTQLVDQGSVAAADGSGNTLSLTALAFGVTGVNDGGTSYQQNTFSTWQQGTMSFDVQCATGRLLVIASGAIVTQIGAGSSIGYMSWSLTGPTTVAQNLARALVANTIVMQAAYCYLHTGLTPGKYTVQDYYQSIQGSGSGPIFNNRSLIAIPF